MLSFPFSDILYGLLVKLWLGGRLTTDEDTQGRQQAAIHSAFRPSLNCFTFNKTNIHIQETYLIAEHTYKPMLMYESECMCKSN